MPIHEFWKLPSSDPHFIQEQTTLSMIVLKFGGSLGMNQVSRYNGLIDRMRLTDIAKWLEYHVNPFAQSLVLRSSRVPSGQSLAR